MPINELTVDESGLVTGTIVNANTGAGFQPTTLVFTLYDVKTGNIINSRNATALTPIGTYVTAGGVLTHTLARADIVLADTTQDVETHRIHYKWTYTASADAGIADLVFTVRKDVTPT